ncbi:reticuline oxidase-like [Aristolochia californica]|uniref:reticuline oxidase-like n=1 Tax=Aristolochia californica TaxID=171875 RepID=UPI0035E16A13
MDARRNIVASLLLLLSFLDYARGDDLLSCLSSGGVRNFTTYYTGDYLQLLQLSIQNLRYAKPFVNKPVALILPENKEQVAAAIRCSTRGSWLIRLRSGGHSFEGLSSRADVPFVLIDLMNLNKISTDLDAETAWVESGATLGEIYHAIATSSKKHGFSGGMCPTTGSGGHISGGGYGALVRKYGLASDNVVDAILVDAEGRLIDRKAMGEDVFWAIRGGGGGNWGAVVAWKIRMLRVPETVTAFRVSRNGSPSEMAKLLHKWQLIASKLEDDFFLQLLVLPGGNQSQSASISIFFAGMYLGPKASTLAIANRAFPELNLKAQECIETSWANALILIRGDEAVQTVEDLKNRYTYRKTFTKAKSDYVKYPIPLFALEKALNLVARQTKASVLLDPHGGFTGRVRSDATPFPHRAGTIFGIEYYVDWNEEDDANGPQYIEGLQTLYEYMTPFVSKNPRGSYVNSVDLDLGMLDWTDQKLSGSKAVEVARKWGEKYFMGNYDRLVRAKTLIDPNNVFRHPQSIPPLGIHEEMLKCKFNLR